MAGNKSVSRRRLLLGLSSAGIVAIAGCTGGDNSQDNIEDSDGDG
jgi:hypothetical protein